GDLAGLLREAPGAEAAALGPDALPRGDRDLPPGPLVHARHELVPVAGLALLGPLPQPGHLPADLRARRGVEQSVLRVVGGAGLQPVLAQVVAPSLEDRERRRPAEQWLERFGESRQGAGGEVAPQPERGR